jgi:alpha-1,4-digalacturonate transport system permease protein
MRNLSPCIVSPWKIGSVKDLAQIRRIGIISQMVDPSEPSTKYKIPIKQREPIREFRMAWENYLDPLERFNFLSYLTNSVIVTTAGYPDHFAD